MDEIEVDAAATSDALSAARTKIDQAREGAGGELTLNEPSVAAVLKQLRADSDAKADETDKDMGTGAGAAMELERVDAAGGAALGGINTGGTGAQSAASSAATLPASALAQTGAARPVSMPMPMTAPQMAPSLLQAAAPMMSAAPMMASRAVAPGQVALSPSQQSQLAAALAGSGESGSGSVGGSGSSGLDKSGESDPLIRSLIEADLPYAWGGGSLDGPSKGISDGGGAADAHGDYNKVGFDCSGLSRFYHYQTTGFEVPRTSEQQYQVGTEIPQSEARKGDFVFPKSSFNGSGGPGHVQIYIGDGKVLEAPQSGDKVKISPMTDSYVKRMDT